MGSQSSSGMSGGRGSSSSNPNDQPEDTPSNQSSSSSRGRRTADRQSASEEDVDLAEVLAYLLRRGQVRLVHGSGATGLQLVQSYSDSDEDSDGAWEGRLGDRYNPPVDIRPDTQELDQSEIRTQIMLATASTGMKSRHSFTHMLTEARERRFENKAGVEAPVFPMESVVASAHSNFLPNYVSHKDTYHQKAFCGLYSHDGSMFLSACQVDLRRQRVFRDRSDPLALPEDILYERYRFSSEGIRYLIVLVGHVGNATKRSCPLTVAQCVCVSLRCFAKGTYLHTVGDAENISKNTVCLAICKVVVALNTLLNMFVVFPSFLPTQTVKEGFYQLNIRLYDTTRRRFNLLRTVKARDVGWSVLDVCFTPDTQHILYSSWSDYIHVCSVDGDSECHTALDLSPDERRFCVFSLAASTDGKEILGGANDGCLYVFDREQNKRTLKIDAHEDDVNAVAFADSSSQLLFSGSDDALCKVWDRRTLREDRPQPVGQLAGHRDGVTFIDSKGDARYLISNSKDQSIKLWDVRKFSPKEGLAASRLAVTQQNWDYRWQQVPQRALKRHKLTGDTSVMTYRGHGVLHTLIRCRFSPEFTTGHRYIYSGCSTGKIIVYDVLTGAVVARLCGHDACVRDVSWHPYQDSIVSSSWDGGVHMWEHRQTHPLEEHRDQE
ncbi:DDB1- and CUL4-associated factor 11 [Merluccius polli]|uniref:DDB1- and CUL4-associated factor 11 n=1 Tax=Merluccius polli TaxID=89951 RepID=A0AA47MR20_MERPO|nr:DDB1- and CUL4-associated factor 11 [Merluccius polli]